MLPARSRSAGLTNGDSYTFTVTATNADGTGAASDPSNAVTPAAVPDAPTAASATAGDQSASVSFTPGFDEGSTITGYTVTAADSTTPANGGQTASGSASPITVTGLTNGDSYTFTVTATNANGTGRCLGPVQRGDAVDGARRSDGGNRHGRQCLGLGQLHAGLQRGLDHHRLHGDGDRQHDAGQRWPDRLGCFAARSRSSGLTNGDSYTFTVTATNANGTGRRLGPVQRGDAVDGARRPDGGERHGRQCLGLGQLHAGW